MKIADLTRALCLLLIAIFISSCAAPDSQHQILVSVRDQELALLEQGKLLATYPVSTSKFCVGDRCGSYGTPLGRFAVAQKIGDGAPIGAVFKDRRRTGEIVGANAPGRDPIVTRIIWLRGLEQQNANAYRRMIYIHGTPEERNIGHPASYGCIRMCSRDIVHLYAVVGRGAEVTIVNEPLTSVVPEFAAPGPPFGANHPGFVGR
jgi:hypothetical protein